MKFSPWFERFSVPGRVILVGGGVAGMIAMAVARYYYGIASVVPGGVLGFAGAAGGMLLALPVAMLFRKTG